jgi:hypothetical protein
MKKELTSEEKEITKTVVDKMENEDSERLINLLRECGISDGRIMMAIFGIGTHTEYYNVLYNRINNQKDKMNEELFKKEVLDILHEIDRNEDE